MSVGDKRKRLEDLLDVDEEEVELAPVVKRRRVDPRGYNWFLTWNNYPEGWKDILGGIGGLKSYCCQPEVGEDGTPHIQGVLVFRNQKLFSTLHRVAVEIHWEKARNLMACKNYCSKLKTAAGDCWVKGFSVTVPIKDPLKGKELYEWQREIVELCEGPSISR